MTTQISIIDPKEYGLEPKKANEMTSGLTSIISERNELKKIYDELIKQELNDDTLKQAKALRIQIRDNRTKGIEPWHKANKAFYLAGGRFVDAVKNKEIVDNERMEAKLEEIEQYFINIEKEAKEKLKAERLALLFPYETDTQFIAIDEMTDEQFNALLAKEKLSFDTKAEQERLAELKEKEEKESAERVEKLRWERSDLIKPYYSFFKDDGSIKLGELSEDEFNIILDGLKSAKSDFDRKQEEQRKENEKMKAELIEKDRLAKIESDKQAKIIAEEKAKSDKLAAELKAKEDAEKQAQEADKLRIEQEEAERLAKERALKNADDQTKVKAFYDLFKSVEFPELNSEAGKLMSENINQLIKELKNQIVKQSKGLL